MKVDIDPYRTGEQSELVVRKPSTDIEKALAISSSSNPNLGLSIALSSTIINIKPKHRAQIYSLVNEIQKYANEAPWEKIFSVFENESYLLGTCYRNWVAYRFLSMKFEGLSLLSDISGSYYKGIADTVYLTKLTDYDNQVAFIRYLNLNVGFLFFNNFRKRRRIVNELKYILNTMKYLLNKYVTDNEHILDL